MTPTPSGGKPAEPERSLREKWQQYRRPGYYEELDYAWTMTIDLDRCTGCEACMVACKAENNLPIVGEQAFALGREMQWIRVERYWEGEYPDIKLRFIPMMCQHCEAAPCETVCPVTATYHNQDGLNVQVYNRCIGTRSCAVYCPRGPVLQLQRSSLGSAAGTAAESRRDRAREGRHGEVHFLHSAHTPRQGSCEGRRAPARARRRDGAGLRAGVPCRSDGFRRPAKDPASRVSASLSDARAYRVLDELNTRPSVIYLKKVTS